MPRKLPLQIYDCVRVVRLDLQDRKFSGSPGISQAPKIGDSGAIVFAYDESHFAVECVTGDGRTIWLADFTAAELAACAP